MHCFHSAWAACTIQPVDSTFELAAAVVDYLVSHPDEIPESLYGHNMDSDAVAKEIERYLAVLNRADFCELEIRYDSEYGPSDSDVFDFLCQHFAALQLSRLMTITAASFDTRGGSACFVRHLDKAGEEIDAQSSEELLQAIADALWGDGADTPWTPDTLEAIAEAIELQRPDLKAARS